MTHCKHLGEETGETTTCTSCKGRVELKLFICKIYGLCTTMKAANGVACCNGRPSSSPYEEGWKHCEGYSLD